VVVILGWKSLDIVENGLEAVKAVDKKDYDLIFMDIKMPELDGIESTKRIRYKEKDKKHTIIARLLMPCEVMRNCFFKIHTKQKFINFCLFILLSKVWIQ